MSLLMKIAMDARFPEGYYAESDIILWLPLFEKLINSDFAIFKGKRDRFVRMGEQIISDIEKANRNERGRAELNKTGWTIPKMRESLKKVASTL